MCVCVYWIIFCVTFIAVCVAQVRDACEFIRVLFSSAPLNLISRLLSQFLAAHLPIPRFRGHWRGFLYVCLNDWGPYFLVLFRFFHHRGNFFNFII